MPKEVECKVMDMTVEELMNVVHKRGHTIRKKADGRITDQYWEMSSGKKLRFRCSRYTWEGGKEVTEMDLTIKGSEENDGKFISEREESILVLGSDVTRDNVIDFLRDLGAELKCEFIKGRTLFRHDIVGARIHHDSFKYGDERFEWVELETDDRDQLHDFCFDLGLDKLRGRLCNKSTLELIREKTAKIL